MCSPLNKVRQNYLDFWEKARTLLQENVLRSDRIEELHSTCMRLLKLAQFRRNWHYEPLNAVLLRRPPSCSRGWALVRPRPGRCASTRSGILYFTIFHKSYISHYSGSINDKYSCYAGRISFQINSKTTDFKRNPSGRTRRPELRP